MVLCTICILAYSNSFVQAQGIEDTTFLLDEVHIKGYYSGKEAIGQNVIVIDSLSMEENEVESLPFILSKHTSLFIKSYGGGISSISLRGNSASQTNVIWNDIPIHSPLLGMSDISGVINHSFSEIKVYPNGKPDFLGDNSAGGSLVLVSDLNTKKSFEANITQALGNYNLVQTSVQLKAKKGALSFSLNPFLYSFKSFYKVSRKGTTVGAQYKADDKNIISFHTWIQDEESYQISSNFQTLNNQFLRSIINWKHKLKNGQFESDLSYINEKMRYNGIFSFSALRQSSNISKTLFGSFLLSAGYSLSNTIATSEGFFGYKTRFEALVFVNGKGYLGEKMKYQINIKNGISENKTLPIIASVGIDYSIVNDVLKIKSFIGNKYRQPSLNDLFWEPVGNPDLKSENGYASEISIIYRYESDDLLLKTSQTVFFTKTDNKIIWLPISSTISEPKNIRKTEAYGIESKVDIMKSWGDKFVSATLLYSFINAKNKSKISAFDKSYNKQLIYVPLHKIGMVYRYGISNYVFSFMINYNDKTYTSQDNEHYLDAYLINDLRIMKKLNIYNNKLSALLGINNLWNTYFEIVEGFPMPQRQIYLSLKYQLF